MPTMVLSCIIKCPSQAPRTKFGFVVEVAGAVGFGGLRNRSSEDEVSDLITIMSE